MATLYKCLFSVTALFIAVCQLAVHTNDASGREPIAFPRVTCSMVSGKVKHHLQDGTASNQVQDFVNLLAKARLRKYFCVEQMEPCYELEVSLNCPAPEDFIATLSFRGEAKLGSDYFVENAQVLDSPKGSPTQNVLVPIPLGKKSSRFIVRIANDYDAEGNEEDRFESFSIEVSTSHTSSQYSYDFEKKIFVILDDDRWQWENIQITPPQKSECELGHKLAKPRTGDRKFVCEEEIISIYDPTNRQAAISLGAKQTAQDFIYRSNLIGVGYWERSDSTSSNAQTTLRFSQLSGMLLILPQPDTEIRPRYASRIATLENKKVKLTLPDGKTVLAPQFKVSVESLVFQGGEAKLLNTPDRNISYFKKQEIGFVRRCIAVVTGNTTLVEKSIEDILAERAWEQR